LEASALSAPAALRRPTWPTVRLLRLRSDEQLVALFRAGSEEAFGVIHDRYRQRLFAYTRQMLAGSRQDAEDALQDVFLRAYGALRASERPVSLRAWLYRVAHNRCIDQLRRPVPLQADVFDVSRNPLHDPLAEIERREDLRRLVADVRRLPQAQRSALLMREMEGLSYEELAGALETTVPAIKSLLVRARIGLVEAAEARDTACLEIRRQLLTAYDKGVRASGQARRHMRECAGCREYRTSLRGVQRSFAAIAAPAVGVGPLGLLAKLGLGGSAAGGGAAAGGGGAAGACAAGGGVVAAGKVVAVVCSVAVVTAGAATEVQRQVHRTPATPQPRSAPDRMAHHPAAAAQADPPHIAAVTGAIPIHATKRGHRRHHKHHAEAVELASIRPGIAEAPPTAPAPAAPVDPRVDPAVTGGAVAPDEPDSADAGAAGAAAAGDPPTASPPAAPGTPLSKVGQPGPGSTTPQTDGSPTGSSGSVTDDDAAGSKTSRSSPRN
jgi:RNA polymerase sigma factor (sigma-70 family)